MHREGEPIAGEDAIPAENEILIGDADMLAGPEAEITPDISESLEENIPWDPPDKPSEATRGEMGREREDEIPPGASAPMAAADLTREDLEAAAHGAPVPPLDPEKVAAPGQPEPDPVGVDSLGGAPPEGADEWPSRMPDASPGTGAIGEGTAGGGGMAGEPATETGATGADTRAADPVRQTGGTMSDSGTSRGPQAREDEPLREDFPTSD